MKLIIAGSRNFKSINRYTIDMYLNFFEITDITEIIAGGCKTGADNAALWYAKNNDIIYKEFPADWGNLGLKAGPVRNKEMAKYGDKLLLIWDGESKGSKDMKNNMEKVNKTIYEVILKVNNVKA